MNEVYTEGYAAYIAGRTCNPYFTGTIDYYDWMDGWNDAQDDEDESLEDQDE